MLALPLSAAVVLLAAVAIHGSRLPLTEARARRAVAVCAREHPSAFGGFVAAELGLALLSMDSARGSGVQWRFAFDLQKHTYTFVSRLRCGPGCTTAHEESGRFELRWGTWVALPLVEVLDESIQLEGTP